MRELRRGPLVALAVYTGVWVIALAVGIAVNADLSRQLSGGFSIDLADDAAMAEYQFRWSTLLVLGITEGPLAIVVACSVVAFVVVLAVRWHHREATGREQS